MMIDLTVDCNSFIAFDRLLIALDNRQVVTLK